MTRKINIISLFILLVFGFTQIIVAQISVTFQVNTTFIPDTLGPHHIVQLRGGLINSSESVIEPSLPSNWGSGSPSLQNIGGDYWTLTMSGFNIGDSLAYKFWGGFDKKTPANNYPERGWEIGLERLFVVPADFAGADTVLELAWFGSASLDSPFDKNNNYSDSVGVRFRVEVGGSVKRELIDENGPVHVIGSLFPLNSNPPIELTKEQIFEESNFSFFSGVVYFNRDSLLQSRLGQNKLEYQFTSNGIIDDKKLVAIPINKDTTLHFSLFQNLESYQDTVTKQIHLGVIMSLPQNILVSNNIESTSYFFDPEAGDSVVVKGTISSLNNIVPFEKRLIFDTETHSFNTNFEIESQNTGFIEYKFEIMFDASRSEKQSPNYIPALEFVPNLGEEQVFPLGDGWRTLSLDTNSERIRDTHFFSDLGNYFQIQRTELDPSPVEVRFLLDMAPAKIHESRPFFIETDSVFLQLESKMTAVSLGLIPGEAFFSSASSSDDLAPLCFTRIDETDIFELSISIPHGAVNDFRYRFRYGQPLSDPENMVVNGANDGIGSWHSDFILPNSVTRVEVDPFLGELYLVVYPNSFQIENTWKFKDLPFNSIPTFRPPMNVEQERSTIPKNIRILSHYPNPFNPTSTVVFEVYEAGIINLDIVSFLGNVVQNVITNGTYSSGQHSVVVQANSISSGVYFLRLRSNKEISVRRITVLK